MDKTTRNALIWGGVLVFEAILLKLLKKSELWFYITLPIAAGFFLAELFVPKPKKPKRNLK